jgi:hypothetical protein
VGLISSSVMRTIPLETFETSAPPIIPTCPGSGLVILIVGAGLSKAACDDMPLWAELVDRVAKSLEKAKGLSLPPERSRDPYVDALEISRRYSGHARDARPTVFQTHVRAVVDDSYSKCDRTSPGWRDLASGFASFVRAIGAAIIVDLNYDTCCEDLLKGADVDFVRRIGSEVHWVGGRPADVPMLWKVHGSVTSPATIVLSPSEYQRLYEVNALGTQLTALGRVAQEIWTVGVGLNPDDIWAYLCGPARRMEGSTARQGRDAGPVVNAILARPDGKPPKDEPTIERWAAYLQATTAVAVLHGPVRTPLSPSAPTLATQLGRVCTHLQSQSGQSPRVDGPRARLLSRSEEFQERYLSALTKPNDAAALAVVEEFRHDFEALREHFLSAERTSRTGMTWCPWVPTQASRSRPPLVEPEDIANMVRAAAGWLDDFGHTRNAGLLPTCAAQSAVAYGLELAELVGIDVSMSSPSWPTFLNVGICKRLVGTNPFFVNTENRVRCHLMQFHDLRRAFTVGRPLFASPPGGADDDNDAELLTESEWEAAMQLFYENAAPNLHLRSDEAHVTIPFAALRSIPPLYPWGFLLSDLAAFRVTFDGLLSRVWALVADVLPGGNQICKGGSLRDRGRRAFRIGSRGSIRIGEHDAFVEPARCFLG